MAGAIDLLKGTVTWFDVMRGFGFITPEDGGENVFVHQSSIKAVGYRSLAVGEAVEFGVFVGNDGCRRAVNVTGPGGAYIKGRRYFGGSCYRCGEVGHMAMDCKSNVVGTRLGSCNNCKEMGHFARECPAMQIKPSSSISNHLESSKLNSISPFSPSVSLPRNYRKEVIRDLLVRFPENMDCDEEEEDENEEDEDKEDEEDEYEEDEDEEEEDEEEITDDEMKFSRGGEPRNWAELPRDVLWVIFKKIATAEILMSAQFVCRPWQQLSREPELWRHIVVTMADNCLNFLVMSAVGRSEGCVEEFHLEYSDNENDKIISYLSDRAPKLRRLRLVSLYHLTETALSQSFNKFPLLEELEISFCNFSGDLFRLACPPLQLKSLKFNGQLYMDDPYYYDCDPDADGNSNAVAFSIAKNMPQLQRLQLIGNYLTNKGLLAILDSCPNLRQLDMRACLKVNFDESMKKKCAEIKDLRLPGDSTADYEFDELLSPVYYHCGGSGYFDSDYSE